jgi:hypothetical protein
MMAVWFYIALIEIYAKNVSMQRILKRFRPKALYFKFN